ncbi:MAG TPA: epoxide hydrolase N-terminal domain-containing protein [Streptosporangiaceae bacterium]
MAAEIIPFRTAVPDAELADLRDRLRRTRWPDREPADDWSQGAPLAWMQDLGQHWASGYDWRPREPRLFAPLVTDSADRSTECVVTAGAPGPTGRR